MGRGRQKAKQTKVARELKYHTPSTDLTALQRELANGGRPVIPQPQPATVVEDDDEYGDYSAYLEDDDEDDGYSKVSSRR